MNFKDFYVFKNGIDVNILR